MKYYSKLILVSSILFMISFVNNSNAAFKDTLNLLKGAKSGNMSMVKAAVKNGENVNVRISAYGNIEANHTPLMLSAKYGHIKIVEYLLQLGAIKTLKNPDDGKTALDYAKQKKHKKIIQLLSGSDTKSKTTTIAQIDNKRDYVTIERLDPPENSFIKPGDVISIVLSYDIANSTSKGPCILNVFTDHKQYTQQYDEFVFKKTSGKLNFNFTVSRYDLVHLKYGMNFKINFELLCEDERFMKYKTYFQKFSIKFRDGQQVKTQEQIAYNKTNYSYPNRIEKLKNDLLVQTKNGEVILKKGTDIIFFDKKHVFRSAVLKKPVKLTSGKNVFNLKANERIFFTKEGNLGGGTLSKKASVKFGQHIVVLKKDSTFSLFNNGILDVGTLDAAQKMKFAGNKYTFPPGTRVGFHDNGNLRILVIKKSMDFLIGEKKYSFEPGTQFRFKKEKEIVHEVYNADKNITFLINNKKYTFLKGIGITIHPNGSVESGLVEITTEKIRGKIVKFRRGVLSFYDDGSIWSGKMLHNTYLVSKNGLVYVMANKEITFYPDGHVKYGTLAKNFNAKYNGQQIFFLANKTISFYDDGKINSGFLALDAKISVLGKVYYAKRNNMIKFHLNGNVAMLYVSRRTEVYVDNKKKIIEPGKAVYFKEDGSVR